MYSVYGALNDCTNTNTVDCAPHYDAYYHDDEARRPPSNGSSAPTWPKV